MEISKIDCGAWLVLHPVDEKKGELRLKMLPLPPNFSFPENADTQATIDALNPFIIGWNLESDGVVIPCTDENKRRYMGLVMRLLVKTEKDEEDIAAVQIMVFPANIDNFLGN